MRFENSHSQSLLAGLFLCIISGTGIAQEDHSLDNRYSIALDYGAEVNGGYGIKMLKRDTTESFAYGGLIGKDKNQHPLVSFNTEYSILDTMYGTPYVGINIGISNNTNKTHTHYGYNIGLEWWNYDSMSLNTYYNVAVSSNRKNGKWSPGLSLSAGLSF